MMQAALNFAPFVLLSMHLDMKSVAVAELVLLSGGVSSMRTLAGRRCREPQPERVVRQRHGSGPSSAVQVHPRGMFRPDFQTMNAEAALMVMMVVQTTRVWTEQGLLGELEERLTENNLNAELVGRGLPIVFLNGV